MIREFHLPPEINSQLPPYVPGCQVNAIDYGASTNKKPKSRFKGVFRCGKKFKAQIQTNGIQHYLGLFDTEEEAAKAYDHHARTVIGPKAKTNFEYDPNEQIPISTDSALNVIVPAATHVPVTNQQQQQQQHTPRIAGAHPKRTYQGIKLKRREGSNGALNHATNTYPNVNIGQGNYNGADNDSYRNKRSRVDDGSNQYLQNGFPHNSVSVAAVDQYGHPLQHDSRYSNTNGQQQQQYEEDEYMSEEDPDWREQIYYWTGKLTVDNENGCLCWRGSWVGSYTGRPDDVEFKDSKNYFEYTSEVIADVTSLLTHRDGSVCEESDYITPEAQEDLLLRPPCSFFKGYYMMDNHGSGTLDKYLDKDYYIEFKEIKRDDLLNPPSIDYSATHPGQLIDPPVYNVIGKGDSDFGVFILTGTFDSDRGVMDMARQYIADDDVRCKMDLQTLKKHIVNNPM